MAEPGDVSAIGQGLRSSILTTVGKLKNVAKGVTVAGVGLLAYAWWTGGGAAVGAVATGAGGAGWAILSGIESMLEEGGTGLAAEARVHLEGRGDLPDYIPD